VVVFILVHPVVLVYEVCCECSTDADDQERTGERPTAQEPVMGTISAKVQVKEHQQTTTTTEETHQEAVHTFSSTTA